MLDNQTFFDKFYAKLRLEAIFKSLILGLIVGFFASFVSAFVAYLLIRDGLIVSIIIFIVVTAVATPLFYFKRFKPTSKMIAHRVDRLGLEERLITMLELENDPSYVAMVQREDAKDKLSQANPAFLKMKIATLPLVAVGVLLVLSTAMIVISNLSANNKIAWSPLAIGGQIGEVYEIVYEASEGGVIVGEVTQLVEYGKSSERVFAVANDGYMFAIWSDDLENAERFEGFVSKDMSLLAVFIPVMAGEEVGAGGELPEEKEEPTRAEPREQDDEQSSGPPVPDPDGKGGDGAGGSDDKSNMIIDGNTDYRSVYDEYLDRAMAMLDEGTDIPDEIREIIEAYFGIII